jgi:F0F1-type ATP synthase assembly protein I
MKKEELEDLNKEHNRSKKDKDPFYPLSFGPIILILGVFLGITIGIIDIYTPYGSIAVYIVFGIIFGFALHRILKLYNVIK